MKRASEAGDNLIKYPFATENSSSWGAPNSEALSLGCVYPRQLSYKNIQLMLEMLQQISAFGSMPRKLLLDSLALAE